MQVTINGELRELASLTILQLLESLGVNPRKVAVELNAEILPKADFVSTSLVNGDKIEIVHFVGGG